MGLIKITILAALFLAATTGNVSMAFPTGIKLSNPGNIRHSKNEWQGMTRLQDDKSFVRFSTPECGIRATMKLIHTYRDKYGLDNINNIIMRYAPPSENDTHAYIKDISWRTGFYPSEALDLDDPKTLMELTKAIVIHEQGLGTADGFPAAWYPEAVYHRAAMSVINNRECAA